jgi:Ca2+/Na+ antiporter
MFQVILSAAMYSASSVELVTGAWLMPMVTFVQAILWMKLSAGTLVELLEVVGMVAGVPPAFLGATLLAWGASTGASIWIYTDCATVRQCNSVWQCGSVGGSVWQCAQ